MTEPTTGLGRPVWVDLSTSDPAAARAFYATLPLAGGHALGVEGG